jgi:predicted RNA-binding Zn-ribbon protein involved in translation (DUF1610 family)
MISQQEIDFLCPDCKVKIVHEYEDVCLETRIGGDVRVYSRLYCPECQRDVIINEVVIETNKNMGDLIECVVKFK